MKIKIYQEKDLESMQLNWSKSRHSKNNPKGYYELPKLQSEDKDLKAKNSRIQDLIGLLEILFDCFQQKADYFLCGSNMDSDAFYKYVLVDIIGSYPYKDFNNEILDFITNPLLKEWVREIFTKKDCKVSWLPLKKEFPKLSKIDEDGFNQLLETRYDRFLVLAQLCNYIDSVQYKDYKENQIIIDSEGKFVFGNVYGLKYGDKHSLSAFLGQFLLRKFPFKDITEFHSTNWKKGKKMVFEHYTPMSFFRDLIWVKNLSKDSSYLFHYDMEFSLPLPVAGWLSVLWHLYRTIKISNEENLRLDNFGYRMRRPYNVYEHESVNISLEESMKGIWNDVHSIESLNKIISKKMS